MKTILVVIALAVSASVALAQYTVTWPTQPATPREPSAISRERPKPREVRRKGVMNCYKTGPRHQASVAVVSCFLPSVPDFLHRQHS